MQALSAPLRHSVAEKVRNNKMYCVWSCNDFHAVFKEAAKKSQQGCNSSVTKNLSKNIYHHSHLSDSDRCRLMVNLFFIQFFRMGPVAVAFCAVGPAPVWARKCARWHTHTPLAKTAGIQCSAVACPHPPSPPPPPCGFYNFNKPNGVMRSRHSFLRHFTVPPRSRLGPAFGPATVFTSLYGPFAVPPRSHLWSRDSFYVTLCSRLGPTSVPLLVPPQF